MARTTTHIETDTVSDVINSWNQTINDFETNKPVAFNSGSIGFYKLRSAGFSTEGIKTYDENVDKLILILRNYSSVINDYITSMTDADIDIESKLPFKDGKLVEASTTSSINVDEKVDEISSSSMGDLEKERENLNKQKETKMSELDFRTSKIYQTYLKNIYKRLLENPEFDSSYYKIKSINLKNINKAFNSMINSDGFNYTINKKNIRKMYNKYMNDVLFNESGFYKTASKYQNTDLKDTFSN